MNEKLNGFDKEHMFFSIGWIFLVTHAYLEYSGLKQYNTFLLTILGVLFLSIKIVITRYYNFKEIIKCVLVFFAGVMVYVNTSELRVLWFAFVIIAAKNINFKKIVKLNLIIIISCFVIFLSACLLGVAEDIQVVTNSGEMRHGLGVGHPNMLQMYIFQIILHLIAVFYNKLKIYHYFFMFLITLIFYDISKSRTGLICTIAVLILSLLIMYLKYKKTNLKFIVSFIVFICLVFTVLPMIYKASNMLLYAINSMMTYRISQAAYFYNAYGIKMFGNYLKELSYDNLYIFLDMGYAKMLFHNGLIFYLIVMFSYINALRLNIKNKNDSVIFFILGFMLCLLSENVGTYIFTNVSLIIGSNLLFKDCEEKFYDS